MDTSEFLFILKPSTVPGAGIGVFTTRNIAVGTKITALFPDGFVTNKRKGTDIPKTFLGYCIARENGMYECPREFNRMEIGWYLNHSKAPNLRIGTDAHYAACDVKADEEILIDYTELGEPKDKRQDYYKDEKAAH